MKRLDREAISSEGATKNHGREKTSDGGDFRWEASAIPTMNLRWETKDFYLEFQISNLRFEMPDPLSKVGM
jgi:hypothetical protein